MGVGLPACPARNPAEIDTTIGRFSRVPTLAELERFAFLTDTDRALTGKRRGEHGRLGFAMQLVMVRLIGSFLEDPLDVPTAVVDFVAHQLEVADPRFSAARCLGCRPDRGRHSRGVGISPAIPTSA